MGNICLKSQKREYHLRNCIFIAQIFFPMNQGSLINHLEYVFSFWLHDICNCTAVKFVVML